MSTSSTVPISSSSSSSSSSPVLNVKVEFSGGLELLIRGKLKRMNLQLERSEEFHQDDPFVLPICCLIAFIRDHLIPERPELFGELFPSTTPFPSTATKSEILTIKDDNENGGEVEVFRGKIMKGRKATVRPGVLVLVNDCDWEVEGGEEYLVVEGDRISFISTLHGG